MQPRCQRLGVAAHVVAPENDGGVLVQPQRFDLVHNAPDQIIHILQREQQHATARETFRGQVLTEKKKPTCAPRCMPSRRASSPCPSPAAAHRTSCSNHTLLSARPSLWNLSRSFQPSSEDFRSGRSLENAAQIPAATVRLTRCHAVHHGNIRRNV
eukprot:COSAG04_NODE_8841_length_925_cov_1.417676_1_plen_156_part_00